MDASQKQRLRCQISKLVKKYGRRFGVTSADLFEYAIKLPDFDGFLRGTHTLDVLKTDTSVSRRNLFWRAKKGKAYIGQRSDDRRKRAKTLTYAKLLFRHQKYQWGFKDPDEFCDYIMTLPNFREFLYSDWLLRLKDQSKGYVKGNLYWKYVLRYKNENGTCYYVE